VHIITSGGDSTAGTTSIGNIPGVVTYSNLARTHANDPRIAQFIQKYAQGPQTPEPGAPCSGGTGTPAQQ
jgi:hypothetical protein